LCAGDRLRAKHEPGQTDPIAFIPWKLRVRAVRNFDVDLDVLWPDDPHWMPPGWEDVTDPVEQLRLISLNPTLATLCFSVNAAYRLLPDPDAQMFLNSHTMLGAAIAGCGFDDDILMSSIGISEVIPGPNALVDDSRLPDITSTLHILNIFSKLSLIKFNQVPFNDILKKGLPLPGSDKQIEEMVVRECQNEMFFRTFTYMVFCVVMGTYDWIGECPYDYITQCWITHFFMFRKREDMVADYADPRNRNLMLYACTAFLIHSIGQVPPFEKKVRETYEWDNIIETTRQAIIAMREALMNARYTGLLQGPDETIYTIIADALPNHSKTLKDPFRTKKNSVASIFPNIRSAGESFTLTGVVGQETGPADMSGLVEVHQGHFSNTVFLSAEHGVGITAASFDALPLTPRGRVTALDILRTLESGVQSSADMYTRLGPGDFSVFMGYIAGQREVLRFEYHVLSDRVRARQERAIREKYQLVEWQPLPRKATHLPFCFSCENFKVFAAGEDRTGMDDVVFMPFIGSLYCFNHKNPDCCHLTEVPMLGGALTVNRATWMICCYCTQLCNHGHPDMQDSYPWCGYCDRDS
jgi:hypothetical protein